MELGVMTVGLLKGNVDDLVKTEKSISAEIKAVEKVADVGRRFFEYRTLSDKISRLYEQDKAEAYRQKEDKILRTTGRGEPGIAAMIGFIAGVVVGVKFGPFGAVFLGAALAATGAFLDKRIAANQARFEIRRTTSREEKYAHTMQKMQQGVDAALKELMAPANVEALSLSSRSGEIAAIYPDIGAEFNRLAAARIKREEYLKTGEVPEVETVAGRLRKRLRL